MTRLADQTLPHADATAVFNALRKIVRAVRISSHEVESAVGVTGSQLFVLRQLLDHPKASMRDLAALTLTDHSSVSVVVTRLVRRRLVTKKASASDGRSVEISLTPKGHVLLQNPPEVVQERLQRSLEGFSAAQLRTFRVLLDRLVGDLGLEGQPVEMFMENLRKARREN